MKKPQAVNEERSFELNELFFSMTDKHGKIIFGNETFVRISGYDKADLIDAPHSVIRHPDMPKTIFKLFWEFLQNGRPIGAYVKNMAADGKYYWVFAFAFPIDGGFLSIRLKPTSAILEKVQVIYEKVLKKEDPKNLSYKYLLELLLAEGFNSYQEFMVKAAQQEIENRDQVLSKDNVVEMGQDHEGQVRRLTAFTSSELTESFHKISNLTNAEKVLSHSISLLNSEFKKLSFVAINMTVLAEKYGKDTASLSVVSNEFSKTSGEIVLHLKSFTKFIEDTNQVILNCSQRILSLKVQMSMVEYYVFESLEKAKTLGNSFDEMISNQKYFCELFDHSIQKLNQDMVMLKDKIITLSTNLNEIHTFTIGLEVIQLVGSIESSRDDLVKNEFKNYLIEMKSFVALLKKSLEEIDVQNSILKNNAGEIEATNSKISGNINKLFELAHQRSDSKKAA